MEKEETEKKGNKLVSIIAGAILGAAALAVTGCEYTAGYSTYRYSPYGSSYNSPYYRGTIISPPLYQPYIYRQPRIITPSRPFNNSPYGTPHRSPSRPPQRSPSRYPSRSSPRR